MTAPVRPGLYIGSLRHRRSSPVAHAFTYPLFMVLLDVDRISELMSVSWCTGYNRWNWASFFDTDHLGSSSIPFRERLATDAARHHLVLPDGPVFLLTHLRYLGHCFNPVSFFYCYDRLGALQLVLAEVNNTFGGSHRYWLEPEPGHRTFRATATKAFYVSPFMPSDMAYTFAFTPPGERLVAHMTVEGHDGDGQSHAFDATLNLGFRPWTSGEVVRALLRHPAMTMRVVAGIHWEALGLWWKGLPIVPRHTATGVHTARVASDSERL